jgi:hypothetical protein
LYGILESEDARVIIELLDRVNNRLFGSYDELQEARQATWQEAEQKAARERQAIAANMRSIGMNDDQISRVFGVR